ncbi:hypothetical protein JCM10908_006178 [Rhodotorula pacifica]|uniref:uncharacterized protein n=1 Tax=Rhodotorula pacifica TaxID=1495444 RepID=UPI003176755B
MTSLAALLGAASLEIVIPSSSSDAAPPRADLDDECTETAAAQMGEWAQRLLQCQRRQTLYRDEVVDLYLVLSLADAANDIARADVKTALVEAQRRGHLTTHAQLQAGGAATGDARSRRAGSLAFPAFSAASEGTAQDSQIRLRKEGDRGVPVSAAGSAALWWLARVGVTYVVIWQFVGCAQADLEPQAEYMDDDDDDNFFPGMLAFSTDGGVREPAASAAASRLERPHYLDSSRLRSPICRLVQLYLPTVAPLVVNTRIIPSPTGDGAILAIDVASAGEPCEVVGFEVDIAPTAILALGAAALPRVEARPYRTSDAAATSQLTGPRDRTSRLFSLRVSSLPQASSEDAEASSSVPAPLPIEVMTSPSQRFTARFGDHDESSRYRSAHIRRHSVDSSEASYLVTVTISVRVRTMPAKTIRSEYRCDLYSSSLAQDKIRPLSAAATIADRVTVARRGAAAPVRNLPPSPHAAAIALISSRTQYRHAQLPAVSACSQAFVGARQYTRKALGASAATGADEALRPLNSALPPSSYFPVASHAALDAQTLPVSAVPTAAPVHGPRRYASLPPSASSATSTLSSHIPSLPPIIRMETPPPMSEAKRSSLPSASSGTEQPTRPANTHRKSWMSGLVSKSPVPSLENVTALPNDAAGVDQRTSVTSNTSSSATAPNPGGTSWDTAPLPAAKAEVRVRDEGNVLVSVSLVPLRATKKRPPPKLDFAPSPALSAPPTANGALSSPSSPYPPHSSTTFAFPPPSPTSPSPTEPLSTSVSADGLSRFRSLTPSPANSSSSKFHQTPRVNVLDIFLVDVFVLNRTTRTKHFLVRASSERRRESRTGPVGVVPLETDIEIGPLTPNSCAACALRFLALRSGSHVVEDLQLIDLSEGSEMLLEETVTVVVE